MRRGLTMIELLLAVSLLTPITLAIAAWTQVAARASASAAEPMRWRAAAEAALQLIHDDLVTGDFSGDFSSGFSGAQIGGRSDQKPRVEVVDGMLRIRTRATPGSWTAPPPAPGTVTPGRVTPGSVTGPATHRYIFDAFSGELRLQQRSAHGEQCTRPLLDRVRQWQCEIDHEHNLLTIAITSIQGPDVARSYVLP
ncbi:MAG: hypothetical protein IH830_03515 [Planctomycetes bacterium]|nr:hypothetical protein [Planctomycetota bacterium]